MSPVRKRYITRLVLRCVVLVLCAALALFAPEEFAILEGMNFFRRFSLLHLLWAVWVGDMVLQIIPIRNKVPLGSQKLFANRFRPIREKINYEALRSYIVTTTKAAYKVFLLWWLLILLIGVLHVCGVVNKTGQMVRMLDVGTGSGCIAVALAKMVEGAEVEAWDVSEVALRIAKRNAEKQGVKVSFEQVDVLGNVDIYETIFVYL